MKFALASLVLGLCVATLATASLLSNKDEEGHLFLLKERLGHFKQAPIYFDLYKTYVTTFILGKNHEKRDPDDYRNVRPSGDECSTFFARFRVNDYKIAELEDLVILDACLGYLYELEAKHQEADAAEFAMDKKFKDLYYGTEVDQMSDEAKYCIADTLYNNFLGRGEFTVQCNDKMLQVFLQFAECQQAIPQEKRASDSYLKIIYQFVKERGQQCFHEEIFHLNEAVRGEYDNNPFSRLDHSVRQSFSKASAQMRQRMWPDELKRLFRAIQNTDNELNLHYLHQLLHGVLMEDKGYTAKFLDNLSVYSTNKLNAKSIKTFFKGNIGRKRVQKDSSGGALIYRGYIDELCNFFRASDSPKTYDFATALTRMVRMIAYPDIFEISEQEFIENILTQSYETGALYLSISSCNILTFTEGFIQPQAANGNPKFKVAFKKDTSSMLKWPDAGFY